MPVGSALKTLTQIWIICASLSFGLSSCASRAIPIGDWAHSADLELNNESLKDLKISVKCAQQKDRGKTSLRPRKYQLCKGLERRFESMGAVITEQEPEADFSVLYIDRESTPPDSPAIFSMAYYLTGFIVPVVQSQTLQSELQIYDHRGVLLDRQPMAILETSAVGWSVLPAQIRQRVEPDERLALSEKFYRFAENRLVSYASQATRQQRESQL